MTKKKIVILTLLCITLVLLIFFTGYSLAKYYTEIEGEGTGTIAKWSFVAGNSEGTINNIHLIDTADEVSLVSGRIAPGTRGSFDIVIDARGSEVEIDYEVKVDSETNLPANMKFYTTHGEEQEGQRYNSLAEMAEKISGHIPITGSQTETITINWEWPYESEDPSKENEYDYADWQDGTKQDLNYKFALQIIGKQSNNS